jgi:hypothetical protein
MPTEYTYGEWYDLFYQNLLQFFNKSRGDINDDQLKQAEEMRKLNIRPWNSAFKIICGFDPLYKP